MTPIDELHVVQPSSSFRQEVEAAAKRIPMIGSKALVDLINGIQVNREALHFRRRQGYLARVVDAVSGEERERSLLIDENFVEGLSAVRAWCEGLTRALGASENALAEAQCLLLEARRVVRGHSA